MPAHKSFASSPPPPPTPINQLLDPPVLLAGFRTISSGKQNHRDVMIVRSGGLFVISSLRACVLLICEGVTSAVFSPLRIKIAWRVGEVPVRMESYALRVPVKRTNMPRVLSQDGLYPIFVNLRYLQFKLLKFKEYNKNICDNFNHNFFIILLYNELGISRKAFFCIIRWCPYFNIFKYGALPVLRWTLHVYSDAAVTSSRKAVR